MAMFSIGSACSGTCETCKIHYSGGCMAGHGDDDYVHASKEWIAVKEQERKDKENNGTL